MTPDEIKAARSTFGLSTERFAEVFGARDGRNVRALEPAIAAVSHTRRRVRLFF
jgi:DNA-binding transcriptional regulator YiaG